MAEFRISGLSKPSALDILVREGLLPQNPPDQLYKWRKYNNENSGFGYEEVIATNNAVAWSCGGVLRSLYRYDFENQAVRDALLTWFDNDGASSIRNSSERRRKAGKAARVDGPDKGRTSPHDQSATPSRLRKRALVVVLKEQVHVYFAHGANSIINLPFEVSQAFAAPTGLLLARHVSHVEALVPSTPAIPPPPQNSFRSSQTSQFKSSFAIRPSVSKRKGSLNIDLDVDSSSTVPRLFALTHPMAEVRVVREASLSHASLSHSVDESISSSVEFETMDGDEKVVYCTQTDELATFVSTSHNPLMIVITLNSKIRRYSIWHYSYIRGSAIPSRPHPQPPSRTPSRRSRRPSSFGNRTSLGPTAADILAGDPNVVGAAAPKPMQANQNQKSRLSESFLSDDGFPEDLVSQFDGNEKTMPKQASFTNRRTSSMLARAELSSQDQRPLNDFPRGSQLNGSVNSQNNARTTSGSRRSSERQRHSSRGSGAHARLSDLDESMQVDFSRDVEIDEVLGSAGFTAGESKTDPKDIGHQIVMVRITSIPLGDHRRVVNGTLPDLGLPGKILTMPVNGFQGDTNRDLGSIKILLGWPDSQVVSEVVLGLRKTSTSYLTPNPTIIPSENFISVTYRSVRDVDKTTDGHLSRMVFLGGDRDGSLHLAPYNRIDALNQERACTFNPRLLPESSSMPPRVGSKPEGKLPSSAQNLTPSMKPDSIDIINGFGQQVFTGETDLQDLSGAFFRTHVLFRPQNPAISKILELLSKVLPAGLLRGPDVYTTWWIIRRTKCSADWEATVVTIFALIFGSLSRHTLKQLYTNNSFQEQFVSQNGTKENAWSAISRGVRGYSASYSLEIEKALAFATSKHSAVSSLDRFMPHDPMQCHQYISMSIQRLATALEILREELSPDRSSENSVDTVSNRLGQVVSQIYAWNHRGPPKEAHQSGPQAVLNFRLNFNQLFEPQISQTPINVSTAIIERLHRSQPQPLPTLESLIWRPGNGDHVSAQWVEDSANCLARIIPHWSVLQPLFKSSKSLPQFLHDLNILSGSNQKLARALQSAFDTFGQCLVQNESASQSFDAHSIPLNQMSLRGRAINEESMEGLDAVEASTRDYRSISQIEPSEKKKISIAKTEDPLIRYIFHEDKRWQEAFKLLDPLRPAVTEIRPAEGVTESAFLEQQKELAQKVYQRTMALPSGEAALLYGSYTLKMSEKIHISSFNTSCVMQPSNNTVNADRSNFTEEKVCWAFFHAGVNTGLRISKDTVGIESTWLVLNKPDELSNRHAGLLLALGLNGHLKNLAKWLAFKYLTQKHNMTSVGLLLGFAASHMGTMNTMVTKLLSIHVSRLLPPGAAELNLSPVTQTAGIMGVGLLYCDTKHRRMSEVMLSEICHREDTQDSQSLSDSFRDEGYRLASGFALGLINLGRARGLRTHQELQMSERLMAIATGTKHIGDVDTLDQAGAGAIVAIALMFLKSNDVTIARKIDIPPGSRHFEYLRPDLLLLRVLAANLIMWDEIGSGLDWIVAKEPTVTITKPDGSKKRLPAHEVIGMPLTSHIIPYFNILAGLCFALALKHAGSANHEAWQALAHFFDKMKEITSEEKKTFDELLTRDVALRLQHVLALGMAMVYAGTGHLDTLRRLRMLHGDFTQKTFGYHQAAHMAIGLLFLGGGRHTLGTSNLAIASLLIAFYPIFPKDILDNRAHCQAFRHLWVFAAEARCLILQDSDSNEPITGAVKITMRDGTQLEKEAPCMLPELCNISKLVTTRPEYQTAELDFEHYPSHLDRFKKNQTLYVRKKSLFAMHPGIYASTLALQSMDLTGQLEGVTHGPQIFQWIFSRPAFQQCGLGLTDAVNLAGDRDDDRQKMMPAVLLNANTSAVDDYLVLWVSAQSHSVRRLTDLRIVLRLYEEGYLSRERGRLRPEWIDRLRDVVLERAASGGGKGAALELSGESDLEDEMDMSL